MGTGILMATACVHLLPPAFDKLQNSDLVMKESMAGLVTLFVILAMQLIEFLFMERLATAPHDSVLQITHHDHSEHSPFLPHATRTDGTPATHATHTGEHANEAKETYSTFAASHRLTRRESLIREPILNVVPTIDCHHGHTEPCTLDYCGHEHTPSADKRISTYILLLGIISHSCIIGMTLGISSDAQFTSLLVALCFHQAFEGFSLSVKVLEVQGSKSKVYWLSALFILATPLASVTGILATNSHGLGKRREIIEGILDAASAGILLFVSMSSFSSSDFGHDGPKREKVIRFVGLWFGASLMAILGKWI